MEKRQRIKNTDYSLELSYLLKIGSPKKGYQYCEIITKLILHSQYNKESMVIELLGLVKLL